VQREEVAADDQHAEQADELGRRPLTAIAQQRGGGDRAGEHDELDPDDHPLWQQGRPAQLAARCRRRRIGLRIGRRARKIGLGGGRGAHQRQRPPDDHHPQDNSKPDDHTGKVGESASADNRFHP
jgi:hypothetical protein